MELCTLATETLARRYTRSNCAFDRAEEMVSLFKHIAGNAILELNLPGSRGSYTTGISLFFTPHLFIDYQLHKIEHIKYR